MNVFWNKKLLELYEFFGIKYKIINNKDKNIYDQRFNVN